MRTGTVISPNQDSKRRQIIEAAREVLARDGLAGCTARAVADASPLTKSAINYYFASMDEIIDLAVAAHVEAMLVALRQVAEHHRDPYRRLHAVVQAYLDTFADQPHAAYLWFEYWIAASRRQAPAPVAAMLGRGRARVVARRGARGAPRPHRPSRPRSGPGRQRALVVAARLDRPAAGPPAGPRHPGGRN